MRFKFLLFLALSVSSITFGQTKSVLKNTSGNTITESLTFGSGKTLTISAGATLNATGATLVGITGGSGAWADITGKPDFAPVATSGLYSDLSGLPGLQDIISVNSRANGMTVDLNGDQEVVFGSETGHYFDASGLASNARHAIAASTAEPGYDFNTFFHANGNNAGISFGAFGDASFGNGTFAISATGAVTAGTWQGTAIADSKIASASTWNAKESALTFNGGLSRSTNTVSIATGGVTNTMLAGSIAASKVTGTAITAADTGTVTNAMLAGSIATNKITGLATSATTDTTNAANISSGTLPAARMPALTGAITTTAGTVATSLSATTVTAGSYGSATAVPTFTVGADGRLTAAANVTITGLNASSITGTAITAADTGTVTNTMLAGSIATSKITGLATSATTDTTNAANISSGTLPAARMPALTGDITSTAGAVATTLATVNSNVGSFTNASITVNAKGLITAASNGSSIAAANPTANAGLTAVNGSATTFMRSDGAPAIDQTIAPTWTGVHTFSPSARTSGSAAFFKITTPTDTTLAASTEAIGVQKSAATRQFSTGAITIQREVVLDAPTYSSVAASTITTAVNLDVADPIAGTNATIANKYSIRAGNVLLTGGLTTGTTINSGGYVTATTSSGGALVSSGVTVPNNGKLQFSSGNYLATIDTGITRVSAGLLAVGNGLTVGDTSGSLTMTSLTLSGGLTLPKTITAAGTTGAQTINKSSGSVNFAAAATSLVVTNSLVTTSSVIICTVGTNDTTMKSVSVVAGAGSFTIYANAAATAETRVNFLITN